MSNGHSEYIASAERRYLVNNNGHTSIEPLLFALGCPTMQGEAADRSIRYPERPTADTEPLIRETLKRAMVFIATEMAGGSSRFVDGNYILVALSEQDRWADCLQSEEDAYALVILLQRFAFIADAFINPLMATKANIDSDYFYEVSAPKISKFLNVWLNPTTPFGEDCAGLTLESFRRAVFGDAWCDLVLTEDMVDFFGEAVILTERPPFMPGLLPAQVDVVFEELPALNRP